MDLLTIITILIIISATFSYLNERFIKLPGTIGVVTISVVVSILILIAGKTESGLSKTMITFEQHQFFKSASECNVGLAAFCKRLHFDYQKLKEQRLPVVLLSTLGVLFLPLFLADCFIL